MSIEMIAYIAIQEMNVKCLLFVLGDNKIISKNHEIGNLDRTFLVLFQCHIECQEKKTHHVESIASSTHQYQMNEFSSFGIVEETTSLRRFELSTGPNN